MISVLNEPSQAISDIVKSGFTLTAYFNSKIHIIFMWVQHKNRFIQNLYAPY